MEAPEISWRPLGRLLVDKGLLTEERLEEALAAQAKTEGRLGDTLVELGYVSRSSLARALAEQYGMELTVETGFGSGLQARIERRHDENNAWQLASGPQSNHELPPLVLVQPVEEPPAPAEDTSTQMAALEEQWAKLAAAEDRVAEVERELEAARANAGRREAQVVRFVGRVRRRDAQLAELSTAGPQVEERTATEERLAELQSELDAVRTTAERRQAQVVRFVGHVRRRDAQIAELSTAVPDVERRQQPTIVSPSSGPSSTRPAPMRSAVRPRSCGSSAVFAVVMPRSPRCPPPPPTSMRSPPPRPVLRSFKPRSMR